MLERKGARRWVALKRGEGGRSEAGAVSHNRSGLGLDAVEFSLAEGRGPRRLTWYWGAVGATN